MASQQQLYEHKENLSRILACLREKGEMTRKELARQTSLSWGCVSESLSDLISRGLVVEEKASGHQGMGRVPLCLKLSDRFFFLGVDVNEMGLRACVMDLSGSPHAFFEAPQKGSDEESVCQGVLEFTNEILKQHPSILGVGFAMQGIYDGERDAWLFPVAGERISLCLSSFLRKRLLIPFYTEHDPNCALLSETDHNREARRLLLRLDGGVGAALGQGKNLFREGLLELGETVIDSQGTRLHEVITLNAMEKNVKEGLCSEEEFLHRGSLILGTVLGNLCHCFALDEILLCGRMLRYEERILPPLCEALARVHPAPPAVRRAKKADPALGAARLAAERHIY